MQLQSELSKHDVVGQVLQTVVSAYFSFNDLADQESAHAVNVVSNRFMSFGSFATNLAPASSYGVIMTVGLSGFMMDIDRLQRSVTDTSNIINNTQQFVSAQGGRESINERLIPQLLLSSTSLSSMLGVSGVDALESAINQGQKIFTINSQNISLIVPQLVQSSDVIADIQNAVNAGDVVTISQGAISFMGFSEVGYVVSDPQTGASAYIISSGSNGSFFPPLPAGVASALSGFFLGAAVTAAVVALFGPYLILGAILLAIAVATVVAELKYWVPNTGCFWQGFGLGSAAVGATGLVMGMLEAQVAGFTMSSASTVTQGAIGGLLTILTNAIVSAFVPSNTLPQCV